VGVTLGKFYSLQQINNKRLTHTGTTSKPTTRE